MLCGALETLADVKLAETKILGSTGFEWEEMVHWDNWW